MSKRLGGIIGCKYIAVSNIQRIGCQPEKATTYFTRWPVPLVRGLLKREKRTKIESLAAPPPPPPPRWSFGGLFLWYRKNEIDFILFYDMGISDESTYAERFMGQKTHDADMFVVNTYAGSFMASFFLVLSALVLRMFA